MKPNIPLYFSQTKKVLNKINRKSNIVLLVMMVFLFMVSFGLQTYLTLELNKKPEQNEKFITDFSSIKMHSTLLNRQHLQEASIPLIGILPENFPSLIQFPPVSKETNVLEAT